MAGGKTVSVRYKVPQRKATAGDFATAILGGIVQRKAERDKVMMQLIPVFAQMDMLEPGGNKGDPNVLSVAGKTFTVKKKALDWADEVKRLQAKKLGVETGEKSPHPRQIISDAKKSMQDDIRLKQMATKLEAAYLTGDAKQIQQAEALYNTVQKRIYGEYLGFETAKYGLQPQVISPDKYNPNQHVLGGKNAEGQYMVFAPTGTEAPKTKAQQVFTTGGKTGTKEEAKGRGLRFTDVAAATGPALWAGMKAPAAQQFMGGLASGARPLAMSGAQKALAGYGSQGLARTAAGSAGHAAGSALGPMLGTTAAYAPYVAGGYLTGKGLGNIAYDLMPASKGMQNAAWQNPFIRAAVRPWAFATNPDYRRGVITPDLMQRLGVTPPTP